MMPPPTTAAFSMVIVEPQRCGEKADPLVLQLDEVDDFVLRRSWPGSIGRCGQEPPDPFRERPRIGVRMEVCTFELAVFGMRQQGPDPSGVMDWDQGVVESADHEGRLADVREVARAVEI